VATTDLVELTAAHEYCGATSDGGAGDALMQTFVTGATRAIENRTGPLVSRALCLLAAGVGCELTVAAGTSGRQLLALRRRVGLPVSVGTDADPWLVHPELVLVAVDVEARTVTLSGDVTVTAAHSLRVGRYLPGFEPATTGGVPEAVGLACLQVVRNRWANEQGAASSVYDAQTELGGTPFVLPWSSIELLGDEISAGFA
jgi:hypothetical protein